MGGAIDEKPYDATIVQELQALNPSWQQTMLRVKDPKVSVQFYTDVFGMTLLNEYHFGPGKGDFSLYFLATLTADDKAKGIPQPGTKEAHKLVWNPRKGFATLELTHNHGTESTEVETPVQDHAGRPQIHSNGNADPQGFGHIAFNTKDVYAAAKALEEKGIPFKKKPDEGRMKGLAFALDPDGYWIELVHGSQDLDPDRFNLSQTMIRVKDPAKSVPFYRYLFGMEILAEKHFDKEKGDFSLFFLASQTDTVKSMKEKGEGEIPKKIWDPCLELTWNHGTESVDEPSYHNGNDSTFRGKEVQKGFGHTGFLVDDLGKFCEGLEKCGVPFVKKPQDGSMKFLAFVQDPTGYWVEIIQRNPPNFN